MMITASPNSYKLFTVQILIEIEEGISFRYLVTKYLLFFLMSMCMVRYIAGSIFIYINSVQVSDVHHSL